MLPECSYRGEQQADHKGRMKWRCVHPKIKRDKEFELVRDENCQQCTYCTFNAPQLIQDYHQVKPRRCTESEFTQRVQACDTCEKRAGNYCTEVGGCGLIQKLQIRDFHCPLGRHNG